MAKTEPLSFFVKLDGPSGPMCQPTPALNGTSHSIQEIATFIDEINSHGIIVSMPNVICQISFILFLCRS